MSNIPLLKIETLEPSIVFLFEYETKSSDLWRVNGVLYCIVSFKSCLFGIVSLFFVLVFLVDSLSEFVFLESYRSDFCISFIFSSSS